MTELSYDVIVDRFEGDYAVLETRNISHFEFPRVLLPKGIREGAYLNFRIREQPEQEAQRRENIRSVHQRLTGESD